MEQFNMNEIRKTDSGFAMDYNLGNKEYLVELVYPKEDSNYKVPYILVTPKQMSDNATLAVEANNLETENQEGLVKNGLCQ